MMKKSTARALAAATVLTGAVAAFPSTASAAPGYDVPDAIPDDCVGRLQTVDAEKTYGQIFMSEGSITHDDDGASFPFAPVSLVPYGAAGGPDDEHGNRQGMSSSLVVAPDGKMHDITHRYGSDANGDQLAEISHDVVVGHGWQGTEDLTYGFGDFSRLYRLTEDGRLTRYTHSDGELKDRTSVFTSGGVALRTVAVDREVTWKGEKADLLLTTTRDGRLREYIVPVDDPSEWTARNVAASGWGRYSQISTSSCGDDGRVILGRKDNGRVSAWYDRNATDGSDADISGHETALPALPKSTVTHQ